MEWMIAKGLYPLSSVARLGDYIVKSVDPGSMFCFYTPEFLLYVEKYILLFTLLPKYNWLLSQIFSKLSQPMKCWSSFDLTKP